MPPTSLSLSKELRPIYSHEHFNILFSCMHRCNIVRVSNLCTLILITFSLLHECLRPAASPLAIVDISVESQVVVSSWKRANWKLSSSFPPRKAERTTRRAPLTCLFIASWCRSAPLGSMRGSPLGCTQHL